MKNFLASCSTGECILFYIIGMVLFWILFGLVVGYTGWREDQNPETDETYTVILLSGAFWPFSLLAIGAYHLVNVIILLIKKMSSIGLMVKNK